jgi:hypothetical protein
LPITEIGEKNRLARKKKVMSPPRHPCRPGTPPAAEQSRIATKNWLFSSSSGVRIAEVRASAML